MLAAATAGDDALLGEALEVLETHFWEERAGALVDVCNRDWSQLEAYRGANANMHGVEAMLATGDELWLERARRITRLLVGGMRVIEHFDADWRPLPHYNRERARASVPALRRDDRALVRVGAAGARARASRARRGGCSRARPRRLGRQRVRLHRRLGRAAGRAPRLHWVLCEAIAAAAVLGEHALQRAWWELAERDFIDREGGSWWHELDASNRPASTVWDGKPDVYHALQATLISRARCGCAGRVRQAGCFLSSLPGGGVIAAAVITSANAARRTSSASGSSGSGSWNTNGPAAIVITLAVALVSAITGTTGPSCSERAEISRPTRISTTMIERERMTHADPDPPTCR